MSSSGLNPVGKIISGQVTGDTARKLSETFGKIKRDIHKLLREELESLAVQLRESQDKSEENVAPAKTILKPRGTGQTLSL